MTRYRTAKLRRIADEDVEESALDRIIREQLDQYFENLGGRQPIPLHQLVHEAVDRPLLRCALKNATGIRVAQPNYWEFTATRSVRSSENSGSTRAIFEEK